MKREGLCLALALALHGALWQMPGPEVAPTVLPPAPTGAPMGEPIAVVTLPPLSELPETMPLPIEGLVVAALPTKPLREIDLNPQGLPPPVTLELPEELRPAPPPLASSQPNSSSEARAIAPVPPPLASSQPNSSSEARAIAPAPPPLASSPPTPFGQLLAAAYGEYGFDRVLSRQIAPPDVPVPPEKRELGIDWIPPDPEAIAGQTGTVTVLLIVAPDGTVERELIDSEGDRGLVELARTTAARYRFAPLTEEPDKYRFITIKYVFAPPSPPANL